MNERIKELAKEAGCSIDGMGYGEGNIEGLAELIVRECVDVAYKYNRCDWADVSKSIKEHFGVEQ